MGMGTSLLNFKQKFKSMALFWLLRGTSKAITNFKGNLVKLALTSTNLFLTQTSQLSPTWHSPPNINLFPLSLSTWILEHIYLYSAKTVNCSRDTRILPQTLTSTITDPQRQFSWQYMLSWDLLYNINIECHPQPPPHLPRARRPRHTRKE